MATVWRLKLQPALPITTESERQLNRGNAGHSDGDGDLCRIYFFLFNKISVNKAPIQSVICLVISCSNNIRPPFPCVHFVCLFSSLAPFSKSQRDARPYIPVRYGAALIIMRYTWSSCIYHTAPHSYFIYWLDLVQQTNTINTMDLCKGAWLLCAHCYRIPDDLPICIQVYKYQLVVLTLYAHLRK